MMMSAHAQYWCIEDVHDHHYHNLTLNFPIVYCDSPLYFSDFQSPRRSLCFWPFSEWGPQVLLGIQQSCPPNCFACNMITCHFHFIWNTRLTWCPSCWRPGCPQCPRWCCSAPHFRRHLPRPRVLDPTFLYSNWTASEKGHSARFISDNYTLFRLVCN